MPEIRVVDQKFFAKLNNGNDYTQNLTDFSTHLKGGILEEIKAVFNVQIEWNAELNDYGLLVDQPNQEIRIVKTGMDFPSKGFAVGDEIKLSQATLQFRGDITSLSVGEVVVNNVTFPIGSWFPDGWTTGISGTDFLTGITKKTALKYDFGLIENNEPINFLSKLTNTNQTYLFEGISHAEREADPNAPLVYSDGKTQGNNKAGYSGSAKVAFVGLSLDKDTQQNEDTTQEFQIEHIFKINPFYRDGELDSLKGIDVPPLDLFNGDMSLKYVFQTEFRTVLSNPNTSMISQYDTQLGSVGYFDESYNGYERKYTSTALAYTVDGLPAERIDVIKTTSVTFVIKSEEGSFDVNTPVIVGHSSVVDSLEYLSSEDEFNTVWTNESLRNTIVNGSEDGVLIKNYLLTYIGTNFVRVNFDIEFTPDQKTRLKDNQDYLLYYVVGDNALNVDQGDKLTGKIDVNYYYKNPDVDGLFDFDKFEQYPHPYEFEEGVSVGFTNAKTFNESGMMADGRFWVVNDSNLNSLKFDITVFKNDNTWNSLRSLEVDLSDQIEVNGIQQIELDSTRGYVLKDGDIFNYLKITTDNNDGTKQYYNIQIGYKIPWQSWLEFKDAPTDFFDKTKSLNGLNQKSSNYSLGGDYGIKVLFDAIVDETNYVKTSEEIKVYDYEEDDQDPTAFTCEIQTYDLEENELANNIIQNDYTQIRSVFTPLVPPTFTESVDMTEVSTLWNRFAHGNRFQVSTFERFPNWLNDQADNVDIFTGFNKTPSINKNEASLYTSSNTQILANDNLNAVYGCYSLDKYEYYSIAGTMFSSSNDDDVIKYDMAFYVDENGVEHTLSLCATSGGVVLDINPSFDPNVLSSQVFYFPDSPSQQFCNVALVYNYGKRDCVQLDSFFTSEIRDSWSNVGDCKFNVNRSSDNFTVDIDWLIKGTQYNHTFNLDLKTNPLTEKFKGFQNIGFSFFSQDQGGFKDVNLTKPEGNFYSIIRIEPKKSQSDNTINEISTLIEAPENNLLTQITGDEKKATLSYNGLEFICQCLVETSKIKKGESYDISSELRPLNLESI
jgi:hypothetical protein